MSDSPPAPRAEDLDSVVVREQVLSLYGLLRPSLLIGWGVGMALAVVYWPLAGPRVTLGWLAALVLWQLGAQVGLRRFEAATRNAAVPWHPAVWARRHTLACGLAGVILGSAMWCFYARAFGDTRFVVLMVLLGLTAGSVMALGHHRPSVWAFMLGLGLPTLVRLLVTRLPTLAGWIGVGLFSFYVLMMMEFARRQCALLTDAVRMRHEQRSLVEQLRHQTEQAERASSAKSRFFAAASHDLRQPLHALSYYTTLLAAPQPPPEVADRIAQCARALEDLFDGILGIARLDAGRVEPQRRDIRLADVQERLRPVHDTSAAEQGLRLRWRIAADTMVHTDPVLIERILGNLLSNALRYTHRGGVLVAARRRGAELGLLVADTGVGMTAEALESAFDEFVQIDNPHRDTAHGVGLGLPTVRRLCSLLGHRLIARSVPGRGSWFEVRLPPSTLQSASSDWQVTVPRDGDHLRGRVLLVDDHEPTRQALQRTLSLWGLQCDAAADAQAAESLSGEHVYDVLLCDFRLPGATDGLTLLQGLQARQQRCRIAAIISGESELPVLPAGVQWLRKPLRPVRLRALLMSQLAHDRS